MPETRSKTIEKIDISLLVPHPLNAEIYGSSTGEDEELRRAIINNTGELIHDPVVHLRMDRLMNDEYRILSGHRRIRIKHELGHERVSCVVWRGLSDADEMLMLFGGNIGRDMKVGYKVKFFSQLKQFLRQHKNTSDKSEGYENEILQNNPFVDIVNRIDISGQNLRMWQIIEMLIGFTEREQSTLTHVCDVDYRERIIATIPDEKRTLIRRQWLRLEEGVVAGQISIAKASKMVDGLREQIKAINTPPPTRQGKKARESTAPLRTEKGTTTNASVHANTFENAYNWLVKFAEKDRTHKAQETWSFALNEAANLMHKWATLVMEELK